MGVILLAAVLVLLGSRGLIAYADVPVSQTSDCPPGAIGMGYWGLGVTVTCNKSGTIGFLVNVGQRHDVNWAGYSYPTYNYWQAPNWLKDCGQCIGYGHQYPDFVAGTPAYRSWQLSAGSGCNGGCDIFTISYNGNKTITYWDNGYPPSQVVTLTWRGRAWNLCDPNTVGNYCYVEPPQDNNDRNDGGGGD